MDGQVEVDSRTIRWTGSPSSTTKVGAQRLVTRHHVVDGRGQRGDVERTTHRSAPGML